MISRQFAVGIGQAKSRAGEGGYGQGLSVPCLRERAQLGTLSGGERQMLVLGRA
jgi:ABC-type branched-subunit amino acid transport system ATPase component